ncbi:6054_t:CDS:2 [Funneliformis caledonium]|uniref:6054_t:CDS:1 n=1 Tax=Funneliformis caledonium TaxID=1117310 RepID=A0A9N9G7Z1_9GLOM|nr:6054_t:CDS:2 [Funneliformis caledonium]
MGTHYLTLTENCESELMADIFRFASLVILEIQKKFPDHTELEELIRFYGKSYLPNYPISIIDSENIRNEYVECECRSSKQNIIKTDHRNRLSNNTLHLLLLVSLDDIQIEDFDFNQAFAI